MKIPFFSQSILEFISSKSNWSGIAAIAIGGWMMKSGEMDNSVMLITYGMGILGIKDAIVKKDK